MAHPEDWFACIGDPVDFDCRECSVGPDAPCQYRSDDTLRHERSARFKGSFGFAVGANVDENEITAAVKDLLMRQGMSLPASTIASLLPMVFGSDLGTSQVEIILRAMPGVRETSPRMFKWQGVNDPPVPFRFTEDLSSGASIARMLAQYPQLPHDIRRKKFKRLVALRRLREFDELEDARESITSSVDHLAPVVLQLEGWRIADAAGFASDGSLVPASRESDAGSKSDRREFLVGVFALELLREFGSVDKSYGELYRELVCHNLGLVANIARKKAEGKFLQYADLFQSGIRGLYRAIDGYDPYMGYEFSTYATPWIHQVIARTIADQERVIRMPVHATEDLKRINKSKDKLTWELGREPSLEEVANECGLAATKVAILTQRAQPVVRLSEGVPESLRHTLDEIGDAEDAITNSRTVEALIGVLTIREREVIKLRFGFGGSDPQTLEEIGQRFGVTRERIRQIESKAIKKLRKEASETFLPVHPSD